jgi:hypothetical protein
MNFEQESIVVSQGEIRKHGFLLKESKVLKTWRKRYLVLTSERLCSFKRCEDKEGADLRNPTESVLLCNCTSVQPADVPGIDHCFSVNTPDRILLLSARSFREKSEWMGAIMNFCLPVLRGCEARCSLANFVIEEKEDESFHSHSVRARSEVRMAGHCAFPPILNKLALGFLESFKTEARSSNPKASQKWKADVGAQKLKEAECRKTISPRKSGEAAVEEMRGHKEQQKMQKASDEENADPNTSATLFATPSPMTVPSLVKSTTKVHEYLINKVNEDVGLEKMENVCSCLLDVAAERRRAMIARRKKSLPTVSVLGQDH